jgi:hypothetical protein
MKQKWKLALGIGVGLSLSVLMTACGTQKTMETHTVLFTDLIGGDGVALSDEDPNLVYSFTTKDATVKNTLNGTEYDVSGGDVVNGTVEYSFQVEEGRMDAKTLEISSPIIYVDKMTEDIQILLQGENAYFDFTIGDSLEEFPDADQGVLVEYTAKNSDCIPYELVLQSGGETYDNYGVSYYFDLDTGDFTHGYYLYYGITVDELSQDATLETNFAIYRYEPASYELN